MTRYRLSSIAVLALLAGCQKQGLETRNNEPDPTILFPRDGDELVEGYAATLRGSVTDTNDHPEDLVVTWLSGEDVLCAEAPVGEDGSTTCDITAELDDTEITLTSLDPRGATGSVTVGVTTRPNDAPVVTVRTPDGAGTYADDEMIVFEASVSDTEDAPADLALAWTDETGAAIALDTVVDSDGSLSSAIQLAAGAHAITLTATDIPGAVGSATVELVVVEGE